jgi:hypothetical protein
MTLRAGDDACLNRRKIMSKTLIHAIAIGAMLLAPSLASARIGSTSAGTNVNVGIVRADIKQPRIHSNVKLLNCHKYARGNGQGGTNWVTVCS